MLYAFLCCHDEAVANSWTKEEDDAVLAKRHKVTEKLAAKGKLGPAVRLMPTTAATTGRAACRLFPFFRRKGRVVDAARPRQRGPGRFRPGHRARPYTGGSRPYPPASRPVDQGEPTGMTPKNEPKNFLRQVSERRSAGRPWAGRTKRPYLSS